MQQASVLHRLFGTALSEQLPDDPRPIIIKAMVLLVLFVGGGTAWMSLAPIDGAVVSQGQFKVRTERTQIQPARNGVISQVTVREGDQVRVGQKLVEISDPIRMAGYDAVRYQVDAEEARNARLRSEQAGNGRVTFPPSLTQRESDPQVAELLQQEERIFRNRRESLTITQQALRQEVALIDREKTQLSNRVNHRQDAQELLKRQTDAQRTLAEQGYVSKMQLMELQRAGAAERSAIGELEADTLKAEQRKAELESRIAETRNRFQDTVAQELRVSEERLFQLRQQLAAQQAEVQRDTLTAGISGTVFNLRNLTRGSVVQPGQVLFELVPARDELIIEAAVPPKDIRHIRPGGSVEVIVPAWNRRKSKPLEGVVEYVSADVVTLANHETVYLAKVRIKDVLPADDPEQLMKPGMPATVYFRTGARTMLEYLFEPMLDSLDSAFRESY